MRDWPSTKAKRVLAALLRIGWQIKRQSSSHRTLVREGYSDYVFAWHDDVELGPVAMRKLGAKTGLKPDDL